METLTKELKITIGMVSVCLSFAFVALVALFVRVGDMDKLGTSVLMLVLVAFVAFGVAVIVDEYKNEERAQIARTTYDTIAELCEEIDELRAHNDNTNNARQLWHDEYKSKTLDYTNLANRYAKLRAERDELALELEEIRYAIKAEQERVADI